MANQQTSANESVKVKRGKVDSLSLYEVTESELKDLEQGGPASLFLNFSIFLLSTSVSFLAALLSTKIESTKTFCVFVIVASIGLVGGIILLLIWYKSRQSTKEIIERIKDRMPKEESRDMDVQQVDAVDKK